MSAPCMSTSRTLTLVQIFESKLASDAAGPASVGDIIRQSGRRTWSLLEDPVQRFHSNS
jgi:hypothetical protein